MIAFLKRNNSQEGGIFGQLKLADQTFTTCEHAFVRYTLYNNQTQWIPKIAPGTYKCVRGVHRLEHMQSDFITFEITGVSDFQDKPVSGTIFHVGNFNRDSEGCILLGQSVDLSTPMITGSRLAFAEFMHALDGVDNFELVIS